MTGTSFLQVASEDEPQSLAEAEQLLNQHSAIREEIDGYAEDYAKMRAMGDRVTQDQTDPQYMFLKQVFIRKSLSGTDFVLDHFKRCRANF